MTTPFDNEVSIPLVYKDVKDIRQVTELEEYEIAQYAANSVVEQYPSQGTLQNLNDFRSIGFPFPDGYTVIDITHAYSAAGAVFWFAIVESSTTNNSEIWRSYDKVIWTPCPIDKSAYFTPNFHLTTISSEKESSRDIRVITNNNITTVVAVGQDGLVVVSQDYINFEVVPVDDVINDLIGWKGTTFKDIAFDLDNNKWMVMNESFQPWQCAINDESVPQYGWTVVTTPLTGQATSLVWGKTRAGAGRFIICGDGEM